MPEYPIATCVILSMLSQYHLRPATIFTVRHGYGMNARNPSGERIKKETSHEAQKTILSAEAIPADTRTVFCSATLVPILRRGFCLAKGSIPLETDVSTETPIAF